MGAMWLSSVVRVRWGVALPCALALTALSTECARAQRTSSLSWVRLSGAESCISTQALAARVEQRLGRRVFVSASQADLSLEGHVERVEQPESMMATLAVSDRQGRVLGRRVLRASGGDCRDLEASLVLVIAIAIDPGASLAALTSPEHELSDQAKALLAQLELPKLTEQQLIDELAVPDPTLVRADPPASGPGLPPGSAHLGTDRAASVTGPDGAHAPGPGLSLRFSAGLSGELGVLPEAGIGGALGLTIVFGGLWPIDVQLMELLDQQQPIADEPGARAEFRFLSGGLGVCPLLGGVDFWLLRGCGGARAGVLHGRGTHFSQSLSSTGIWFELTLYAGLWLRFEEWSLHANLGAGVPVVRDTFRYTNALGEPRGVHRANSITGRLEIGAGLHF
jgi:hypothetical protein